jgi:hypothetical protein
MSASLSPRPAERLSPRPSSNGEVGHYSGTSPADAFQQIHAATSAIGGLPPFS